MCHIFLKSGLRVRLTRTYATPYTRISFHKCKKREVLLCFFDHFLSYSRDKIYCPLQLQPCLFFFLDRGRVKVTRLLVRNVEEERRIGQSMLWVSCYTDEVITGVTLVAVCPPAARMSLLTGSRRQRRGSGGAVVSPPLTW